MADSSELRKDGPAPEPTVYELQPIEPGASPHRKLIAGGVFVAVVVILGTLLLGRAGRDSQGERVSSETPTEVPDASVPMTATTQAPATNTTAATIESTASSTDAPPPAVASPPPDPQVRDEATTTTTTWAPPVPKPMAVPPVGSPISVLWNGPYITPTGVTYGGISDFTPPNFAGDARPFAPDFLPSLAEDDVIRGWIKRDEMIAMLVNEPEGLPVYDSDFTTQIAVYRIVDGSPTFLPLETAAG